MAECNLLEFSNIIKNIKNKKILVFSHDDPDGITSAAIFKYILSFDNEIDFYFPGNFVLLKKDLLNVIDKKNYNIMFILDKGTFKEYDNFHSYIKEIYIVDHHFSPELPEKIKFYNPSSKYYIQCSNSYLSWQIAKQLELNNNFIDLMSLIGLKGDFAIDPSVGSIVDFVSEFYEHATKTFPHLLDNIEGTNTMFDIIQRKKTSLLSILTEMVHAVSGGGFQYFYNDRDSSIENINAPYLIFENLYNLHKQNITGAKNLNDFFELFENKELIKKIYYYFKDEWKTVMVELNSSVHLADISKYAVFLYLGENIKLLPMAGSIKLYEISKKIGKDMLILLVNKTQDGVHISFRATTNDIHSGKIGAALQKELKSYYKKYENLIFGGGHPKAAELRIKTKDIPFGDIIIKLIEKIQLLSKTAMSIDNTENPELTNQGLEMGLEYLSA